MSKKKAIVDNGIILYYDYEFIFNFLSEEESGIVLKLLFKTRDNPTLNPTDNQRVNNAYNYIASRIIEYKKSRGLASEWGKKGGNPNLTKSSILEDTLKGEDKEGVKDGVKLTEHNITKHNITELKKENIKKEKKFQKPTLEEIKNYCQERNKNVNPEKWLNHYESNGWLVGKNKMKDWKAAIRTWEDNKFDKSKTQDKYQQNREIPL